MTCAVYLACAGCFSNKFVPQKRKSVVIRDGACSRFTKESALRFLARRSKTQYPAVRSCWHPINATPVTGVQSLGVCQIQPARSLCLTVCLTKAAKSQPKAACHPISARHILQRPAIVKPWLRLGKWLARQCGGEGFCLVCKGSQQEANLVWDHCSKWASFHLGHPVGCSRGIQKEAVAVWGLSLF